MDCELKRFEATLLRCDDVYHSSRPVYSDEIIDMAIEECNKNHGQLFVESFGNDSCEVDMTKVVGLIENIHRDDKEVKGTVILLDTPDANLIKDLDIKVNLVGHGDVDWSEIPYKVVEYHIDKAVVKASK